VPGVEPATSLAPLPLVLNHQSNEGFGVVADVTPDQLAGLEPEMDGPSNAKSIHP
jgi:hypothetical protein